MLDKDICQASSYLLRTQDSHMQRHSHALKQHGEKHQVVLSEDG